MKRNCSNRCGKKAAFITPIGKAFCSTECCTSFAANVVKKERVTAERQNRKETKKRKDRLNDTVSFWTKKAQVAFNAYIRERDLNQPCISCDSFLNAPGGVGGYWDCGHYRSVGSCKELRFEPLNAHKQCKKCNRYLSGNVVEYRARLKERIGQDKLDWVEGPHKLNRYRVDDLKAIEANYKQLKKDLKNGV